MKPYYRYFLQRRLLGKHGAQRLLRVLLWYLVLPWQWLLALAFRLRCRCDIQREPCDVLLLHPFEASMKTGRKNALVAALRARGLVVHERWMPERSEAWRRRWLAVPRLNDWRYYAEAAFVEYIMQRHTPRIVITERNGCVLSPILRARAHGRALIIHLAHGVVLPKSGRMGMIDFDYYFLFGKSSLANLRARDDLYGACKAVLAGSYLLNESLRVDDSYIPETPAVLVLGSGPEEEQQTSCQSCYRAIADWARVHPDIAVLVRPHRRAAVDFWSTLAAELPQVTLLDHSDTLPAQLARVQLVITSYTNAILEAGLLGRPAVLWKNTADWFGAAEYFGEPVDSCETLGEAVARMYANLPHYRARAKEFAQQHLAHGFDSCDFMADLVRVLHDGKDNIPHEVLAAPGYKL